jgi:hypothetical protein
MPNEFKIKNGFFSEGSSNVTGSLSVSGGITGSLLGTASFATQALSSSFATTASYVLNGGVGSTFPYTGSALITGSLGITGSLTVSGSTYGIKSSTGELLTNNISTVAWGDLVLSDIAGQQSVKWGDRTLYDQYSALKLDWENGVTYDSTGKDSVNWQARQLINTSLTPTVDWENTQLFDGSTIESVNWSQRKLYDSSNTLVLDWEAKTFTGNSNTATSATSATSASFASTASFVNPLNQQVVITGSLRGNVSTLSISSNTASLNMSSGNFFILNLVNGANTHINPTNLQPGRTVNIRVNQGSAGTGTVSFPSTVDQPSGSAYTGSQISNAIDIVTMITFDSSLVFVSSVRNMI